MKFRVNRRGLLKSLLTAAFALSPALFIAAKRKKYSRRRFLRPPGALVEHEFKDQCIGCFKCATACPNDCIEMAGMDYGWDNIHTPVIVPRSQACILCMRCNEVCPTGALQEISRDKKVIQKTVKMGIAKVNEELCFSYHGRTCGVCFRACPYAGTALTVGQYEQPTVHPEHCVGCGLCEQACIHMPQAIRVVPS